MSQPDYYQLLGVSVDALAVELEAAYRRITAFFGPDANPEPFAAKIHAAATDAWRVLSDPARRETYDRLQRAATARRLFPESLVFCCDVAEEANILRVRDEIAAVLNGSRIDGLAHASCAGRPFGRYGCLH